MTALQQRRVCWLERFYRTALVVFVSLLVSGNMAYADDFQIGVFYFPGWKDNQLGAPSPQPWAPIKKFPEKEPALGWYDEGTDDVMRKQLDWMQSYGIDFVAFDWYYSDKTGVLLEHALSAFMRAPNRNKTKFSILWANHAALPKSQTEWQSMVRYWIKNYFPRPEFLRINNRPVVFVFSAYLLKIQAESLGITTKTLLDSAQTLARQAGLQGIHFVAGTGADLPMIDKYAKESGYSAFSAYNYHQGPMPPLNTMSHSYKELDQRYRSHWERFAEKGNLPLIVPMTSGWDKRPWGGSTDPDHDNSLSTPDEFRAHLEAAKSFMNKNPALTNRMGVICCWNEFGEGSYIEPTKSKGVSYLEMVRRVFGSNNQ